MYDRFLLDITTPYGDQGGTHPKVINFKNLWHGYKYWMVYSPYPEHNAKFENPVIIASNNLTLWEYPNHEIENNVLDSSSVDDKIYNSDPHLVYNPKYDHLEVWWRYVNDANNFVMIYRKCSKDGIVWSEKEIMLYSSNRKEYDFVSPSILIIDGIYYVYYVHRRHIHMLTITDGFHNGVYTVSTPNILEIPDNGCWP